MVSARGLSLGHESRGFAVSGMRVLRIAAFAAVVVAGVVVGGHVAASTKPAEAERHCVIEVTGVEDGVFVTRPEICFASRARAASHAASIGADLSEGVHQLARSSNTIGIHYTSTSFGGSSVRIVGSTCGGGVWYPTGAWDNNIESSRHYCGSSPTTFYDSSSCSGWSRPIHSAANSLRQMNNRASCVRYG